MTDEPARLRDVSSGQSGHRPALVEWPSPLSAFAQVMTPVEAAQYLRLHETGSHTPASAVRTLNYWRSRGELKATRYARRVWYLRSELDRFLKAKTEP